MKKTPLYYYLLPLLLALVIVWLLTGDYGLAWLSVAVMAGSIAGAIMFAIGVVLLFFRRITIGSLFALTLVAMLLGITFSFEEIGFGVLRNLKGQYTTQIPQQEVIKLGWGKKLWFSKGKGEKIFLNFDVQGKREFTRAEFYDILSNDLKKQLNRPITIYGMYSNLTDPIASHDQPHLNLKIAINNDENLPYGGYLDGSIVKYSAMSWSIERYKRDSFIFYQSTTTGDVADKIGRYLGRQEVLVRPEGKTDVPNYGLVLTLNKDRWIGSGYLYIKTQAGLSCYYRYPGSEEPREKASVDFYHGETSQGDDKYYNSPMQPHISNNVLTCGDDSRHAYQFLPVIESADGNSVKVIIRQYERL